MLKRGSISLSINAIVVVVLAFVMLGLGLAVTNMIFSGVQSPLEDSLDQLDISAEAGPQNVFAFPDEITVSRRNGFEEKFQIFNNDNGAYSNVEVNMSNCKKVSDGSDEIDGFSLVSLGPATVDPSETADYVVSISTDLTTGKYFCSLRMIDSTTVPPAPTLTVHMEKTVTVEVTA